MRPFDPLGPLPRGRCAIEASAGTGKTHTLVNLAVRFLAETDTAIAELLLVTYTRAAAAELEERLRGRLREVHDLLCGAPAEVTDPTDGIIGHLARLDRGVVTHRLGTALADFDTARISTIHGFCQKSLASLGSEGPLEPDLRVASATGELVTEVVHDLVARVAAGLDDDVPETLVGDLQVSTLEKNVRSVVSSPGIVVRPRPVGDDAGEPARAQARLVVAAAEEVLRRREKSGVLDFDDLLTRTLEAVREPTGRVAGMLMGQIRVALVDEFQDTDPVQWEIFSALFPADDRERSLVLVGDPKQSIYRFRGADVETFVSATRTPTTERFSLGVNWRSDAALVEALGAVFEGAGFGRDIGFEEVAASAEARDRRVTDSAGRALPPVILRRVRHDDVPGPDEGIRTPQAERAVFDDLGRVIRSVLDTTLIPDDGMRPALPRDVAVLVKSHNDAARVLEALTAVSIPAVVQSGGRVTESEAAIQWYRLLSGIERPADLGRVKAVAAGWFGGLTLREVAEMSEEETLALRLDLVRWGEVLAESGFAVFTQRVWSDSDVLASVMAGPDGERHITDLEHLAELMHGRTRGRAIGAAAAASLFEDLLAESAAGDPELYERRMSSGADAVQIMTIHASKGLEFPIVACPTMWRQSARSFDGLFHDPDTGEPCLDVSPDSRGPRAWPDPKTADARKKAGRAEQMAEGLRLAYVALTRARHQVLLWWPDVDKAHTTSALGRLLFVRPPLADRTPDLAGTDVPKVDFAALDEVLTDLGNRSGGLIAVSDVHDPLPQATASPPDAEGRAPALAVARFDRDLDQVPRRWSFTSLAHTVTWDHPTVESSPLDDDPSLGDAGAGDEFLAASATGIGTEPSPGQPGGSGAVLLGEGGGTGFGTLVHSVLEHLDFQVPDVSGEVARIVSEQGGCEVDLAGALAATVETPLGADFGDVALGDLSRSDRLDELEFELPLAAGGRRPTLASIGRLITTHLPGGDPLADWARGLGSITGARTVDLAGYLTGSIDLVMRLPGPGGSHRYVVADYKTNRLGPRGEPLLLRSYHPDLLPAAMAEHHYPLQALLYQVALHRFLRWRLAGYEPGRHLGGIAYLFVRGMVGRTAALADGRVHGVFAWRPPVELVTALSDHLDGGGPDRG